MSAHVSRPTENAAVFGNRYSRPLPSTDHIAALLRVARATRDRYGTQYFSRLLDRALGLTGKDWR